MCHLLALLGAHHILHVSRIRVKHRYQHPNVTEMSPTINGTFLYVTVSNARPLTENRSK